jgi:uncharacterized protein YndB with AHSA1/START domain
MTEDVLGALRLEDGRLAVRLERGYPTDMADLWSALTDPARLSRWFARVEGDLRPGGGFCIYFADDPGQQTPGQVLACEPPSRLVISWRLPGEPDSLVSAELSAAATGTWLTLEHRRLPADQAAGYGAGWQTYLEQLAAYLAGDAGRGEAWDQRWDQLVPAYRARVADLSG